jgi:hypothetical protein
MFGLLIVILFAWWTDKNEKPLPNAIACAALYGIYQVLATAGLAFGSMKAFLLLIAEVGSTGAYCAAYYSLLNRNSGKVGVWLLLLIAGAVLWYLGPLLLFH